MVRSIRRPCKGNDRIHKVLVPVPSQGNVQSNNKFDQAADQTLLQSEKATAADCCFAPKTEGKAISESQKSFDDGKMPNQMLVDKFTSCHSLT